MKYQDVKMEKMKNILMGLVTVALLYAVMIMMFVLNETSGM
jgi:hypothetical protein